MLGLNVFSSMNGPHEINGSNREVYKWQCTDKSPAEMHDGITIASDRVELSDTDTDTIPIPLQLN